MRNTILTAMLICLIGCLSNEYNAPYEPEISNNNDTGLPMYNENTEISGHILAYTANEDGSDKKVIVNGSNAIQNNFLDALRDHSAGAVNSWRFKMSNLQTGQIPFNGNDGIAIQGPTGGFGTQFYVLACTFVRVSSDTIRIKGTYTNGSTAITGNDGFFLGTESVIVVNPYGPDSYNYTWGWAYSAESFDIPANQIVTVQWTIEFRDAV